MKIDENSKNKRKTLKKRLRAEMQVAQERMKLEEIIHCRSLPRQNLNIHF
jgi:hypothetical protein